MSEVVEYVNDTAETITSDLDGTSKEFNTKKVKTSEDAPLFFLQLPILQWKTFSLFLSCCFGILINWLLTSEIFMTPPDVALSRKEFFAARDHYEKKRSYWDAKQIHFSKSATDALEQQNTKQLLSILEGLSGEIFIAFLIQKLHINLTRPNEFAAFPRKKASSLSIILSKYERSIWPLKIMLSLELGVKVKGKAISFEFLRLRRGSEDQSLSLAWPYFGSELEPLQQLKLLEY